MLAECHAHIFMDGVDYRTAAALWKSGLAEKEKRELLGRRLEAYRLAGVEAVRDGGDPYGAGLAARELAPEYGIVYRTPGFALHKEGHYGKIVGKGFNDLQEYRSRVRELRHAGGDFVKLMTTGIMDFASDGHVTGEPLAREEVFALVAEAHEQGLSVMVHTNGAQAVIDAVEAGADTVEHGFFQTKESIRCMAEHEVIWVPTLVTVKNLLGMGRFSDEVLEKLCREQEQMIRTAWEEGVSLAAGSDAGAFGVLHGEGIRQEYAALHRIIGEKDRLEKHLEKNAGRIFSRG